MWYELAIMLMIGAVDNILFGQFEELTPKWRRVLKFILYTTVLCLISWFFGRTWFYITLCILSLFVLIVHGWVLPKKGINGWTAEPKEKYYELRGWKKKN